MNKLPLVLLVASVLSHRSYAQGPNDGFVMESEATSHLIQHPDPIYPPIAKAAHVQGTVLLHVSVNQEGRVTDVDVLGGPPMLRTAAADAVRGWTYTPFQVNGSPSPVKVVVSMPFSLGIPNATEKSDQAIGQAYFPKSEECHAANHLGHWSDAVRLCGEAYGIAMRFPDISLRSEEVRLAREDYGEALAFNHQLPEALEQFQSAVAIAQKYLKPLNVEYGSSFYWLAFAEHASGSMEKADADYQTAEDSFRLAMAALPDMKTIYSEYLAHALNYHAVLMDQTGRSDRANKMRQEAQTLDPSEKKIPMGGK